MTSTFITENKLNITIYITHFCSYKTKHCQKHFSFAKNILRTGTGEVL